MPNRISHLLDLATIVISLTLSVAAQTNPPAECPTIEVTGPAGIMLPDEEYTFNVRLVGNAPSNISYEWEIRDVPIVSGKNSQTVRFKVVPFMVGNSFTATVHISGLPSHCTSTGSETAGIIVDPGPIHLSTISDISAHSKEIRELMDELEKYPSSQGYLMIGTDQKTDRHKEIENIIRESALQNGIDQARLTIVREETAKEIVEIWRVPPGADNPLCRDCEPVAANQCPNISVTGPAGQIYAGDPAIFTVNPELDFKGLKFHWTVSAGTITAGQGKPWIEVQSDARAFNGFIEATVEITGLPDGCKNLTSQTAGIKTPGDPVMFDEYGPDLSIKDELGRLDLLAAEWKQRPTFILYFIVYLAQNETSASERARIKRIIDHLTKTRKIPCEHVVILKGGKVRDRRTVVYLIPPEADKPVP